MFLLCILLLSLNCLFNYVENVKSFVLLLSLYYEIEIYNVLIGCFIFLRWNAFTKVYFTDNNINISKKKFHRKLSNFQLKEDSIKITQLQLNPSYSIMSQVTIPVSHCHIQSRSNNFSILYSNCWFLMFCGIKCHNNITVSTSWLTSVLCYTLHMYETYL